jgi:1,3-beta-glucan synthase
MYFSMLILFVALIVGPIVASKFLNTNTIHIKLADMILIQPNNWNNNDTTSGITGSGINLPAAATSAGAGANTAKRMMYSF